MVRNVHYKLIEKVYIFNISTAKIVCFVTPLFLYCVASFFAFFFSYKTEMMLKVQRLNSTSWSVCKGTAAALTSPESPLAACLPLSTGRSWLEIAAIFRIQT